MRKKSVNKNRLYIVVMFSVVIVISLILYNKYNKEKLYLVKEGIIENSSTCIGYIIKDETLMEIDDTKVIAPTVSEGARVSKNNIIATYRGEEYESYQEKIQNLDNQILEAMKNIDVEYSIEVNGLEKQVVDMVIASKGVSSVMTMQESKNNINQLLGKRANLIGELSPEKAVIKELLNKRKEIEESLKTSSSNIKAEKGGIISYSVDGLETKLTKENVFSLNYEDVKSIIEERKVVYGNKIKIASNYEAYIFVRAENVDNKYIEKGKNYKLKVMGSGISELTGEIVKLTETEQGCEVLFRITNGLEEIIENRECEIEIVWSTYEGLVVPLEAISEKKDGRSYVTILTRGDYVDIPVIAQRENSTFAIVENYEKENVNDYILERYDQVVVGEK